MPDFSTMTPDTASAIIGVLSVLVFAMVLEVGRVARTNPARFRGFRNPPPRLFIAFATFAYLVIFGYAVLTLLTVVNGEPSLKIVAVWLQSGGVFLIDAFVLAYFSSSRGLTAKNDKEERKKKPEK